MREFVFEYSVYINVLYGRNRRETIVKSIKNDNSVYIVSRSILALKPCIYNNKKTKCTYINKYLKSSENRTVYNISTRAREFNNDKDNKCPLQSDQSMRNGENETNFHYNIISPHNYATSARTA